MNDMKNTKTDWIQMKRDRARNAEHIADIQRTNRHVLICDVITCPTINSLFPIKNQKNH
jgi:lipoate synthase